MNLSPQEQQVLEIRETEKIEELKQMYPQEEHHSKPKLMTKKNTMLVENNDLLEDDLDNLVIA